MNGIQVTKLVETKPRSNTEKAQAAEFLNWGIYLVILGIVLAVGALILQNFSTTGNFAVNSVASNTLAYSQQGIGVIGQYLPLIALVVVASGLIMLVVRAFTGAGTGGRGPRGGF